MSQGPGNVSSTKHSTISQAQTGAANNKVVQANPVAIQGIDTRNGQTFTRSFATYAELEQWLATDASASFYDFSSGRMFQTNAA